MINIKLNLIALVLTIIFVKADDCKYVKMILNLFT